MFDLESEDCKEEPQNEEEEDLIRQISAQVLEHQKSASSMTDKSLIGYL